MIFQKEIYDEVTSTNTMLYERAKEGAPEGLTIIANRQSAGKGRRDRSFISPTGNLYFSFLIRPDCPIDKLHLLTPLIAVCVYKAVADVLGIRLGIKWVNDLYYKGKKVCGILTEICPDSNGYARFCVIGIGINVYPFDVPDELKDKVGWILEHKSDLDCRTQLIDRIQAYFDAYFSKEDLSFIDIYRNESILIGRTIFYEYADASEEVYVKDISDDGELIVVDGNKTERRLYYGEVKIIL